MKQVDCPRCHGTGKVEDNGTLVGLAPFQDRPSGVNDDDWNLADQDEDREKTALAEVPIFMIPKRLKRTISDRPPRKIDSIPVEAMGFEEDAPITPPISARAQLQPPPRRKGGAPLWFTVLFFLSLGMVLGAFAMAHKNVINGWLSKASSPAPPVESALPDPPPGQGAPPAPVW